MNSYIGFVDIFNYNKISSYFIIKIPAQRCLPNDNSWNFCNQSHFNININQNMESTDKRKYFSLF